MESGDRGQLLTGRQDAVGPVVGQVQTDTFCEGCGYNLVTQSVIRDERLGILVCRCPECGRYAAAGRTTSADRVWLNRLGTVTLAGWVFFLLGVFAFCALFLGMLAYGQAEEGVEYTATGSTSYRYYYVPRNFASADEETLSRHRTAQFLFFAATGILCLLTGTLFSTFFWHVRGALRGLALLPAMIGIGLAMFIWVQDPSMRGVAGWGATRMSLFFLYAAFGTMVGVFTGRSIARGVLKILVPPRARQHLAFLWITDGKALKP